MNIKTENEEYIVLETLKTLENQLPSNFVRVHRSFILNSDAILSINGKTVIISSSEEIPIGETYRKDFFVNLKKKSI